MAKLSFSLGDNIGEILLDIAQNKIKKGDFEGAIKTYTDSFEGFTYDYALKVLKNEVVIIVTDNGARISLSDDEDNIKENTKLIVDWDHIIKKTLKDLNESCLFINSIRNKVSIDLNDYCLYEMINSLEDGEHLDPVYTLVARYIGGEKLDLPKFPVLGHLISNGDDYFFSEDVNKEMSAKEKKAYAILKYVDCIKYIHCDFMFLNNMYNSLLDNGFIQHVPMFEDIIENVLCNYLIPFCNTEEGYHHPMCDEKIIKLKESMYDDISKTSIGKEYIENGIIAKNILDGYDAGYLAPDGTFYGLRGEDRELLHVQLGDMLVEKKFKEFKQNGSFDIEYALMKEGYMKIHHDRVFGMFAFKREEVGKDRKLWCPTETQLQAIYNYANKFYGGRINTDSTFGINIVSVSALRQMDEIALHNTFKI